MNDPQKKYRLGTVCKNILLEGLNQFHGANIALNSDVDQDTFGKVTKHNKQHSQEVSPFPAGDHKATRNKYDGTTYTTMKHNSTTNSVDPDLRTPLSRVCNACLYILLEMIEGPLLYIIILMHFV